MSQEINTVTEFIHVVSGLNSGLIRSGDLLMQDFGLTNARWRVMQSIRRHGVQTVARMARSIGLRRQGVQRIVNELEQEGFVRLIDNPDHKRARLVQPTAAGSAALDAVSRRYDGWADQLENRFSKHRLERLTEDLRALQALVRADGAAQAKAENEPESEPEAALSDGAEPAADFEETEAQTDPARLPDTPLWP